MELKDYLTIGIMILNIMVFSITIPLINIILKKNNQIQLQKFETITKLLQAHEVSIKDLVDFKKDYKPVVDGIVAGINAHHILWRWVKHVFSQLGIVHNTNHPTLKIDFEFDEAKYKN